MPAKSKYIKPEDAAGNGNGEGPLSILTAREQTMLLQGLLTVPGFPGGIQIDYSKVAERMGLKNPRSVANAWSLIKGKIAAYDVKYRADNDLPSAAEEAAAQQTNAAEEDENPAPRKRGRPSKASLAAAAAIKPTAAATSRRKPAAAKAPRWSKTSIMGPLSAPLVTADDSGCEEEEGSAAQEEKEDEEMGSSEENAAGTVLGEV